MLRRRLTHSLIASISVAALIGACGSSEDTADESNAPEADSGSSSNGTPNDANGATPSENDGSLTGADDASQIGDSATLGPDGDVVDSGISEESDGATLPPDSGTADEDSGVPVADSGVVEDSGVPNVDGPDVPPVSFPSSVPLLFGYTLEDAFPGTFLSGAMDMDWPSGSDQPFVLQRGGHIVRLLGGGTRSVALNFETQVAARGEGGALGMALHPKFNDPVSPKPYVYVWYNAEGTPTHQRLSRWTYNSTTKVFDPATQIHLVDQTENVTEHNGAHIRFGPDGFLYFGNGDDQREGTTAQTLSGGLFSGIFRIDVDSIGGAVSHAPPRQPANCVTQGYFIPNSNPFVGVANANEEYYALGFRNPYSFTFDRSTGALWEGDVGASFREEINQIVAGGNYQWPAMEGKKLGTGAAITIGTSQAPKFDYPHWSLADLTAIMGGYVYRGGALPELAGKYIHSDWPVGRVWAFDPATGSRISLVENNADNAPVGFGQDANGEIYLIAWSKILKLVRAPAHTVPTKLSDTKIFRNMTTLKTPSALVPYTVKSPLWSDGLKKDRWVYIPAGQKATMTASGTVNLPAGSLLIKHFALPDVAQPVGGRSKKLETRVFVIGASASTTYGVTYKWNTAGTDADLVVEGIDETIDDVAPAEARTWHYPSAGECWSCHRPENRVLGFRGEQLNFTIGGVNQLTSFVNAGIMDGATIASSPAPLAAPDDTAQSLDARANAYMAANCSPCHHSGASFLGGTTWNASNGVATNSRGIVNVQNHNYPMGAAFGMAGGVLVKPGNPNQSILLLRMKSTDADLRMPPLGRTRVDNVGVNVIESWINQLP